MNIINKIIIFILSILIISCKQETKSENSLQIINCEFTNNDCIKLSDFAESIEIIPLETDLSCLIGTVGKIIKYNDMYYIGAASNIIDRILVFNKNGKFIYKLDKRGLGAGEYTEIRDFDIIDDHKIVIISHSNPSIYVYDISKDSCILQKSIDIYPNNILAQDDGFYIMNNGTIFHKKTNDLIFKYDKQGNFMKSCFSINKSNLNIIANIAPLVSLSSNDKNIYFNYPLCNTIYKIDDTLISSKYKLDFGKKEIPENILNRAENILDIEKFIRKNEGINMQQYYAINSTYSLFTFFDYQYNGYILLHNRASNKTLIAHKIIDDIYFKGNKFELKAWKMPKLLNDNKIYYHIEPNDIIEQYEIFKGNLSKKEWENYSRSHPDLIDKINNIREDDNPLIMSIKLKI